MTTNQHAERQARAAVESVLASVSDALRRKVDALRAEFDLRLAALEPSGELEQAGFIERLVEDLSGIAAREAEQAATAARHDADEAAERRLAAAQAAGQSLLEQERADNDGLRRTIDELQAQAQEAASAGQIEVQAIREELAAALDQARDTHATLSASLTAAQQDAAAARDDVQERSAHLEATTQRLQALEAAYTRVQQTLAASEAQLAGVAGERTALADALAAAHQATTEARTEAGACRADNDALRRTIEEIEAQMQAGASTAQAEVQAVRAEFTAALDEAREAHVTLSAALTTAQQEAATVETALHERTALLEATERRLQDQLEAADQATIAARAETDACRAELCDAHARAETLQHQLAARRLDAAPLARVRRSLRGFAGLTGVDDVLKAFVAEFGREFERVALFAVRENRLEGWHSVGFEPTTDVRNLIIPLTINSPLTQAAAKGTSIMVASGPDGPRTGLLGHDTFGAIAIPISSRDRVVAVAYAEMARNLPKESRLVELQIAEILADQLTESLTMGDWPSSIPIAESDAPAVESSTSRLAPAMLPPTSYQGPARAVDRVRIPDTLEVLVDAETSWLVDISSRGAQILSPKALHPNRQVRMLLPRLGEPVPCQGVVVWALFEIMPDGRRYRAGLKFTKVDNDAVEAFVNQQKDIGRPLRINARDSG